MRKILISVLAVLSITQFSFAKVVTPSDATYKATEAPTAIVKSIYEKIQDIALEYHVDPIEMTKVIACESGFLNSAIGDNGHSHGIVQIYLPAHPQITKEEAHNEDFALKFMASEFSKNNQRIWSCYRLLKANGSI